MTTQEEDDQHNATSRHQEARGEQEGKSCCQKLPDHCSLMTRAMMHHVANSSIGIRKGATGRHQELWSSIDSAVTHKEEEPFCPLRALESLRREEHDYLCTVDTNGDADDDDLEDSIDVHRRHFDSSIRSSNQQKRRNQESFISSSDTKRYQVRSETRNDDDKGQ